jgi:Ca2+:H+ antiporter
VTEDLALRCGQLLGGLINATFGNVVEVILSLAALHKVGSHTQPPKGAAGHPAQVGHTWRASVAPSQSSNPLTPLTPPRAQGLLDVVAASLLGSILSNLLLVLGCCFLLGGMRHRLQKFNKLATRVGGWAAAEGGRRCRRCDVAVAMYGCSL